MYKRAITREHRTAYMLLLDISGSMQDTIELDGQIITKGEAVVTAANTILRELHLRAYRDDEIRNYYDVAVLCYSGRGIHSLLDGATPFVPITELCAMERLISLKCLTPLNVPEELHGTKIVVETVGCSPMHEALDYVYELLKKWCCRSENFDSAPPTIFHITDGHATDGDFDDIVSAAKRIKSLATNDGNILMLNIHLGTGEQSQEIIFPTENELAEHPNPFFRAMGYASSIMPTNFAPLIHEMRESRSTESYRGVGCNVSIVDMITMMNIGTLSVPVY